MIRRNLFAEILLLVLLGCCVDRGITRQLASSSGNSRPVELIWGIEEVQTPVGKLFNFTIPKDAFAGEIVDIKVRETCGNDWSSVREAHICREQSTCAVSSFESFLFDYSVSLGIPLAYACLKIHNLS
jgi:hypothetical protein